MKTCNKCSLSKPLSAFSLHSSTKKPRGHCKSCAVEMSRKSQAKRRAQNPEQFKANKARQKRLQVLRRFGITENQMEEMGDLQNWNCYLCGNDIIDKPYIDHNHSTNKVRKLLCLHCNVGLGHFKDSVVLLEKAIAYLKEHDD